MKIFVLLFQRRMPEGKEDLNLAYRQAGPTSFANNSLCKRETEYNLTIILKKICLYNYKKIFFTKQKTPHSNKERGDLNEDLERCPYFRAKKEGVPEHHELLYEQSWFFARMTPGPSKYPRFFSANGPIYSTIVDNKRTGNGERGWAPLIT